MRKVILSLFIVWSLGSVLAVSGVSPGSYEVNFVDGIDEEFIFNFIFDDDVSSEIYVSGPLSEFITLDKDSIVGSEGIVARLNVGSDALEFPGLNKVRIGAREMSEGENSGVGIKSDVWGVIKVSVPYPGKFVDLDLVVPNSNVGENINISLVARNLGNETVIIAPEIQIFKSNEKIDEINFENVRILPYEEHLFYSLYSLENFSIGEYMATGIAMYGEDSIARADDPFRVGIYSLSIENYSKYFAGNKINHFEVEVLSGYNGVIEDVYADVEIYGPQFLKFRTDDVNIKPFKSAKMKGFIDLTSVDENYVSGKIKVYYGNETLIQEVTFEMEQGVDFANFAVLLFGGLIFIFILKRVTIFSRNYKKYKRS